MWFFPLFFDFGGLDSLLLCFGGFWVGTGLGVVVFGGVVAFGVEVVVFSSRVLTCFGVFIGWGGIWVCSFLVVFVWGFLGWGLGFAGCWFWYFGGFVCFVCLCVWVWNLLWVLVGLVYMRV